MNSFLDLIPFVLILGMLVLVFVILPWRKSKLSADLIRHFKGSLGWPLGTVSIAYIKTSSIDDKNSSQFVYKRVSPSFYYAPVSWDWARL